MISSLTMIPFVRTHWAHLMTNKRVTNNHK